MRTRTVIAVLLTAGALALAAALPALAQEDSAPSRDGETIRLDCEFTRMDGAKHDRDDAGVACRWSPSHHHRFAGYRLWRMERGTDQQPRVVFETGARDQTRYFDDTAACGHYYGYVVEVVDAGGERIGHSNGAAVACRDGGLLAGVLPSRPLRGK